MLMKKEHVILALILVLAFILRLYGVIVDVDFFFREATYGIAAWRILDGDMIYRDFTHPQAPLTPFLFAFVFLIFGVGIIQARLFIVFFTTFSCFVIFLVGKKIDYKTGLLGSLIFAIVPVSVSYGMMAVNDFIAVAFCIIGYYFLTSVLINLKDKRDSSTERNNLILAGLFVSIGVLIRIIVAPIFLAFIVILIIEGQLAEVRMNDLVKYIAFFITGFVISLLIVSLPFYLLLGDEFTTQVLGQHLSKGSIPLRERWRLPVKYLIRNNLYLFVFFALSIPFAIRKSYGRGLIICILFMVFTIFLFVPRQYFNYYEANIPLMAMVCGFFPLPNYKSLNFKSVMLNSIVVLNLLLYKIYRHFYLTEYKVGFFSQVLGQIAIVVTLIFVVAFIVILTKEGQFSEIRISSPIRNVFSSSSQILNHLKRILNHNLVKFVLASALIVLIATTGVSYPVLSERDKKAIDWIKANTSPDDYILTDDLKINFRATRRSPFAEISKDLTDLGELTGEMFIEACYEYDIRVVVNAGRMFAYRDTYNVFLEFLEENYVPIKEGHTIYVRTTPLV